jgi:pimeloyl-ACP methyl ester carboxylesterase
VDLRAPERATFIDVNRTTLRLWEWGAIDDPPIVCLHGAFDHGRMWDEIGPTLADRGFRVVAPDLRGHGDSGRLSSGHAWQAIALDIAILARHLGGRVGLVGHSFGGNQALFVAAMWPEHVVWVVDIDGLGPPASAFDQPADLSAEARAAFDALDRLRSTAPRTYPSLDDMAERRRRINIRLPDPWIDQLTRHGAVQTEGGWRWKVDPMFSIGFPGDFDLEMLAAQHAMVECPVLVLSGTEPDTWSDLSDSEIAERVGRIGARHQAIAAAGHYAHCEQPNAVMAAIDRFLAEVGR